MRKEMEAGMISMPSNLSIIIDDYFKLYLPEYSGPPERPPKTTSPLWEFATRIYIEGNTGKRKPRTPFRCLACQHKFENLAISVLKDHFQTGAHSCKCPNVTPSILERLQKIYPKDLIYVPALDSYVEHAQSKVQQEDTTDDHSSSLLRKLKEAQQHVQATFSMPTNSDSDRKNLDGELFAANNILEDCVKMLNAQEMSMGFGIVEPSFSTEGQLFDESNLGWSLDGAGGLKYEEQRYDFGLDIGGDSTNYSLQQHQLMCPHDYMSRMSCNECYYEDICNQQQQMLPASGSYYQAIKASDASEGNSTTIAPRTSSSTDAGCWSESARQDQDGRKHSRDELTTVEELKRQRTTGAFGEASPVIPVDEAGGSRSIVGAAVNLSAKPSDELSSE